MSDQISTPRYTLHYSRFSIRSLMIRLTIALRTTRSPEITLKHIELFRQDPENVSEEYMLNVNPKGQVPTLTGGPEPLSSTLAITRHLASHSPNLLPPSHSAEISRLLSALHDIEFLSLSIPDPSEFEGTGIPCDDLDALIAKPGLGEAYREVLIAKRELHEKIYRNCVSPANLAAAKLAAESFLSSISSLRTQYSNNSPWIFGPLIGGTALDAHAALFIARLQECGNGDLVPADLDGYLEGVKDTEAWKSVMEGRPTTFSKWLEEEIERRRVAKENEGKGKGE